MKILIIDDDKDIREIIEFSFTCEIQCEILQASSGNEGIEVLKTESGIDLVICDYNMPDGNGGTVFTYINENNLGIPYVFCSSDNMADHEEFAGKDVLSEITKPFVYEGIQKALEAYNKLAGDSKQPEKVNSEYLVVGLDLLLKTPVLPCDLFIELSGEKVLKILNKSEKFSSEEYDKYSSKGMKHLLIKREDLQAYAESFIQIIENILSDEDADTADKVYDSHTTIMVVAKELGLSEKLVRAAAISVDSALELFKESKDFEQFEKHIFRGTKNYLTVHSIALAYIATAILKNTRWDSPETRKKVVLAGFLHDASIRVPIGEAEFKREEDYVNFEEHPKEAQEIIKRLKNIPPDLDRIILEHHERPDGSGFPRKLDGTQVHPLSSVFIFSHDIVDLIFQLKSEGKEVSDDRIQEMLAVDDYTVGNFKKCYEAFLKVKIFE